MGSLLDIAGEIHKPARRFFTRMPDPLKISESGENISDGIPR
jgi:hypothetical protein